jgi:hypothetical protein
MRGLIIYTSHKILLGSKVGDEMDMAYSTNVENGKCIANFGRKSHEENTA